MKKFLIGRVRPAVCRRRCLGDRAVDKSADGPGDRQWVAQRVRNDSRCRIAQRFGIWRNPYKRIWRSFDKATDPRVRMRRLGNLLALYSFRSLGSHPVPLRARGGGCGMIFRTYILHRKQRRGLNSLGLVRFS